MVEGVEYTVTVESPWWVRPPLADSNLSWKKAMRYWSKSSIGTPIYLEFEVNQVEKMGCSGLKPIVRANLLPNVVQRSRVLHYGVSRDYRAKVGNLPEQEI